MASHLTGFWVSTHGFVSPRQVGAHRLPRAVTTLAEKLGERGFTCVGAVSTAVLEHRLTGLGQGFDVWNDEGLPRSASALGADIVVERLRSNWRAALDGGDPLFAVVHLGDLRMSSETPRGSRARLARELLKPLVAEVTGLAEALALESDEALHERLEELIGRRRGSVAWEAWQRAGRRARMERLDTALAGLVTDLEQAGRLEEALVVVAGTRGPGGPALERYDRRHAPFAAELVDAGLAVRGLGLPASVVNWGPWRDPESSRQGGRASDAMWRSRATQRLPAAAV